MQVLIELADVHKCFGSKRVLQGCNIQIRRGEAVGIIGGSGSGKSTTLRLMAGLMAPDWVRDAVQMVLHAQGILGTSCMQSAVLTREASDGATHPTVRATLTLA